MRWLLYLWAAPLALVGWVYPMTLWACGLIKPAFVHPGPVVEFRKQPGPAWWEACWRGWFGHSMWFAMIVQVDPGCSPPKAKIEHELFHCRHQWLPWGPLAPFVYLWLLLLHGYWNHPWEVAARKHAGG